MKKIQHFVPGQWNFICDLCGMQNKSGRGVKTWNGLYVCIDHKEVRNPQDFVRGVLDDLSVPWSRPECDPIFVPSVCNALTRTAIPSLAVAGCVVAGYAGPYSN